MPEISYKIKTTDIGIKKLAAAFESGVKVNIKSIKFGDSNGVEYTPEKYFTDLKNIVHTSLDEHINLKSVDGLLISIEVVIPENTEGEFWIREMGIYDNNDDLIFISAIPPRKKADPATGPAVSMIFGVEVALSNADNITFMSNSSLTYVTQADYDLAMADKLDKEATAVNTLKFENKTKAQVIAEARSGLSASHSHPYLGSSATAVNTLKFENKTKAQVIAEARSNPWVLLRSGSEIGSYNSPVSLSGKEVIFVSSDQSNTDETAFTRTYIPATSGFETNVNCYIASGNSTIEYDYATRQVRTNGDRGNRQIWYRTPKSTDVPSIGTIYS